MEEVLGFLPSDPEGTCVDGTLGGGGHARAIVQKLGHRGLLIGVDQDAEALEACRDLEAANPGKVRLRHRNFSQVPALLREEGLDRVSGILLDLGVSSRQVDEGGRGFSFLRDGPLDMRMGPITGPTAADLVNGLSEEELAALIGRYGEEPRCRRVARSIVEARRRSPIATTGELARVVERALGRRGGRHPGTRVFQALRIAVNRELEALESFLSALPGILAPQGRVVVIAYHSLEDRLVKQSFRGTEALRVLTPKVVKPKRSEIERNPRARSARLRAAERLPGMVSAKTWQGERP